MDRDLLLKYILEQPAVITETLKEVEAPSVEALLCPDCELPSIYIVGSGSSLNAGYAIKPYWLPVTVSMDIYDPVNFCIDLERGIVKSGSIVMGISQSGQSLATVDALKRARDADARTWAITAKRDSSLSKVAGDTVLVRCGEELVGPKTKGYSATVATLVTIAQHLQGKEVTYSSVARIQAYIEQRSFISDFVSKNAEADLAFLIGSSGNYGTAREGALKMMEIAKVPSMYFDLEDSMHGPFTTMTRNSIVIVLGVDESVRARMEGLMRILQRIGAQGFVVSDGIIQSLNRSVALDRLVCDPIADIVPIQLLSYELALARKVHPTKMSYDAEFVRRITKLALDG